MNDAIILVRTRDRKGLLAEISGFFYRKGFNVLQCRQYTDTREGLYFMRIRLDLTAVPTTRHELETELEGLAKSLGLDYSIYYGENRQKMAILVSKTSHCLYDLLTHAREGDFNCEIPLIIGNHPELERVADQFRIPFFCCPVGSDQAEQERQVIELLKLHRIDLVVLARYMRILSDRFINEFPSRIINIHHAFLPAFQGGDPYTRAWERGVKMIGATAHYATADLDEGPIIEQDVERITHEMEPDDLKRIGKDIERRVLSRAVRAHLERRIILSGRRTIIL